MKKGKFITFEGGEGAGKSTQVKMLADSLKRNGIEVITTREPGGSVGGEAIRSILVDGEVERWDPIAESLLLYAARRDHLTRVILPAINDGKWVISDRFADSTTAYQGKGYNGGVDLDKLKNLYEIAVGNFYPDLTFILDVPAELGLARALARNPDKSRFEKMGQDFHNNLRKAFLEIAQKEPNRCVVVSASSDANTIQSEIISLINQRLGLSL